MRYLEGKMLEAEVVERVSAGLGYLRCRRSRGPSSAFSVTKRSFRSTMPFAEGALEGRPDIRSFPWT